ncbi:MAG: DNA repair protein RecO [Clostridiales bacterium]|nr:DNA repair protein RecO [Clostridiales bacterium]
MEDRTYLLESLIIRSRDYGEADKIITVYSREQGKKTAIAKGVRKAKSSLRGSVQLFSHSQLALAKGRSGFDIITQGQVVEAFVDLRSDLDKIVHASYLAELTDLAAPEQKPGEDLFFLLLAALYLLAFGNDHDLAIHVFELRFLALLGLSPNLESCSHCGRKAEWTSFYLSPVRGALICAACHREDDGLISAGTVQVMQKLQSLEFTRLPNLRLSRQNREEMRRTLAAYLDYHLDYAAKARRFLK